VGEVVDAAIAFCFTDDGEDGGRIVALFLEMGERRCVRWGGGGVLEDVDCGHGCWSELGNHLSMVMLLAHLLFMPHSEHSSYLIVSTLSLIRR
jgi:hypothetical protein